SCKKHGTNLREASFLQKTWNELAGKPASCKKHGTNLREASFLQKTWDEFVGKPASCKKHGTNLRGSQLPAKNKERTYKQASFPQKTRKEFAKEPASWKINRLLRNSCERKRTTPILGPTGRFLRSRTRIHKHCGVFGELFCSAVTSRPKSTSTATRFYGH